MARVIPEGAFLYKEGLYIVETTITMGSLTRIKWELYSADGWCFYDLMQAENYVDGIVGGELLPENQRVYAQYMIMTKNEERVTNELICVPVKEVSEEVSAESNAETA